MPIGKVCKCASVQGSNESRSETEVKPRRWVKSYGKNGKEWIGERCIILPFGKLSWQFGWHLNLVLFFNAINSNRDPGQCSS